MCPSLSLFNPPCSTGPGSLYGLISPALLDTDPGGYAALIAKTADLEAGGGKRCVRDRYY